MLNPFLTHTCPSLLFERSVFRELRSDFVFLFKTLNEIPLSKQNSTRWEAAFCGVTSGTKLFAYVPQKRPPGLSYMSQAVNGGDMNMYAIVELGFSEEDERVYVK